MDSFPTFPGIDVTDDLVTTAEGSILVVGVRARVNRVGGKRKIGVGRALLGPVAIAMAKKEGGQLVLELEDGSTSLTIPIHDEQEEAARAFAQALMQAGVAKTKDVNSEVKPAATPPSSSPVRQPPEDVMQSLFARTHRRAQQGVNAALEQGETVQVVILGEMRSSLIATDRRAFIYKGGITSGSLFSNQLNSWDYRNISGIEVRKNMTIHSVILQVPGVAPVTKTGRMDKGPNSAWEAPNALMVGNTDLSGPISSLRQLIAEFHQPVVSTPAPTVAPDPIDQITRLAELRDQGALSDEEFQAMKQKLLGL